MKTSGVTFDQQHGRGDDGAARGFLDDAGIGSAMGATYDSQHGYLTLDAGGGADDASRRRMTVQIHAQHAEFDRDAQLCRLRAATAEYRGGQATRPQAKILFRDDGSAQQLDATGGFTLTTATGGHLAAPTAAMDFDEHNQPRHGHLEGGVTMDSKQKGLGAGRPHGAWDLADGGAGVHGPGPAAARAPGARRGDAERGATSLEAGGQTLRVSRTWRSPVADVDFRDAWQANAGKSQVEPATIHGTGGVVMTSESQRGDAAAVPSKMAADEVTGTFGAGFGAAHDDRQWATRRWSRPRRRERSKRRPATGWRRSFAAGRATGNEGTGSRKPDQERIRREAAAPERADRPSWMGMWCCSSSRRQSRAQQPQPPLHATAGQGGV